MSHPTAAASLVRSLGLEPHPEGGFFRRTHENPLRIPNPFTSPTSPAISDDSTRLASTSIYYLLTPESSVGHWHRNKSLTYHLLHSGRGRYRLIHEGQNGGEARVEEFVVGHDVEKGEKLMWIVEGSVWKMSMLEGAYEGEGLLISEVVVPGFEFKDHEFMKEETLLELVGKENAKTWGKYLRKE